MSLTIYCGLNANLFAIFYLFTVKMQWTIRTSTILRTISEDIMVGLESECYFISYRSNTNNEGDLPRFILAANIF